MSLPSFSTQQSLFGVGSLADRLFDPTNRYRLFAETIWPRRVAARPKLEAMYCAADGRPAAEPVVLLGVCLLQFLDRVPDRAAMELLTMHLGWKRALHRDWEEGAYHPTSLVYFRERLLEHEQAKLVFDAILDGLAEAGLVRKRAKQRLDSTHVLGLVRRMGWLENVRETLRLALEELEAGEAGARPAAWARWWERYVETKVDYRLEEGSLREKFVQAGTDAAAVLAWVDTRPAARAGKQVALLRRVFGESFEQAEGKVQARPHQPTGAVHNPHEPEAQWSSKTSDKRTEWVGSKVQVAETVNGEPREKGEPTSEFVLSVVTQPATHSDEAGMAATFAAQAASGLEKPGALYGDGAYVSAGALAEAAAEGRELVGPAQPSALRGKGYRSEEFAVEVAARRAVCPAGEASTQCSRLEEEKTGKVSYRFEWSWNCRACVRRAQCVGKGQRHRSLVVGEHHGYLQTRRQEQKPPAFRERMKQRPGIEGTHSELVRGHGLRRARYRGLAKVTLQNYLVGAACNVKRWLRRMAWEKEHPLGAVALA